MLKISRLTDYGLLATVYLAKHPAATASAREIAAYYSLPVPALSKVLKLLHDGRIVESHRGTGGGYSFSGNAESITLAQLIEVLEGPWDLVDCETTDGAGHAVCTIRTYCPSRNFMWGINRTIKQALGQVTLGDLVRGVDPSVQWNRALQMTDELQQS